MFADRLKRLVAIGAHRKPAGPRGGVPGDDDGRNVGGEWRSRRIGGECSGGRAETEGNGTCPHPPPSVLLCETRNAEDGERDKEEEEGFFASCVSDEC